MLKVFSHYFPSHTLQQVIFDAVLLFLVVLLAVLLQASPGMPEWEVFTPSALTFAFVMVALNTAMGLYRPVLRRSHRQAFARVALSLVVSVPVAYVVFGMLPWASLATHSLQASVVLLLCSLLLMRGLINQRQASGFFSPKVLIIGTGRDAALVYRDLTRPLQRSVEVVGFLPAGGEEKMEVDARQVVDARNLVDAVRDLRVSEVIVAVRERRGGVLPIRELLDCKLAGVRVIDLSSFFERVQGQVRLDSLRASWLIYGDGFRQGLSRTLVKRVFDLLVASLLIVVTLPLMLITALLILLEDGAPVFYRAPRITRGFQ